jgi:hypothetical protein
MNDDFKEELKDCYAEIEQNRIDLNEYRLDVERLRAALLRIKRGSVWNCDIEAFIDAALAEEKA